MTECLIHLTYEAIQNETNGGYDYESTSKIGRRLSNSGNALY